MPKKKQTLRHYKVPILTEEYKIYVYLGDKDVVMKAASKYLEKPVSQFEEDFTGRGLAINSFKETGKHYPVILIDGSIDKHEAIATIGHEASHAMDYISEYLGLYHTEFNAHGVAAVLRTVLKDIL